MLSIHRGGKGTPVSCLLIFPIKGLLMGLRAGPVKGPNVALGEGRKGRNGHLHLQSTQTGESTKIDACRMYCSFSVLRAAQENHVCFFSRFKPGLTCAYRSFPESNMPFITSVKLTGYIFRFSPQAAKIKNKKPKKERQKGKLHTTHASTSRKYRG